MSKPSGLRLRAERRLGIMLTEQKRTVGLAKPGPKKFGSDGEPNYPRVMAHYWEWHIRGWQIVFTVDLYSFMFGFSVGPRDVVFHCAFATLNVIDWNCE